MNMFNLRILSEYGKFILSAYFEEKYYSSTKSNSLGISLKSLGTDMQWYGDNEWAKSVRFKLPKIEETEETEEKYKSIDDIVYLPELTEKGFVFDKKQLKLYPQLIAYDLENCMHVYSKKDEEWIKVKGKYDDEFSNFLLLLLDLYDEK